MATLKFGFNVTFEEAIEAAKARGVVLPRIYYNVLPPECRRLAFSVSLLASVQQIQAVLDQLSEHLAEGKTFDEFKAWGEQQSWTLPPGRLQTVFRNGVQTAYNAGHWRQFEEGGAVRPWLMYDAINDSRTRPAHAAMDGYIRKLHDPFWDSHSPPCGHNCRCSIIALTDAEADRRSPPGRGRLKPESDEARPDDPGWGRRPDKHRDQNYKALIDQQLAKKTKPKAKTDALQKAVEKKKQEPERPWDPTKPGGVWHEHAFTGAPEEIMRALRRWPEPPNGVRQTPGEQGAHYAPGGKYIEMGELRQPHTLNGQGTWRHEFGHHIDARLAGGTTAIFRSALTDFKTAMWDDAAKIIKKTVQPDHPEQYFRPASVTEAWRKDYEKNRKQHLADVDKLAGKRKSQMGSEEYLTEQRRDLAKLGFDLDDLRDAINKHGVAASTNLSWSWNLDHMIVALRRGDPTTFMRHFLADSGPVAKMDAYWRGSVAHMDDLICSATMTRAGNWYGHDWNYYQQAGYCTTTECFANLTDLLANENPFFTRFAEHFAPKMTAIYRKIMSEET